MIGMLLGSNMPIGLLLIIYIILHLQENYKAVTLGADMVHSDIIISEEG